MSSFMSWWLGNAARMAVQGDKERCECGALRASHITRLRISSFESRVLQILELSLTNSENKFQEYLPSSSGETSLLLKSLELKTVALS